MKATVPIGIRRYSPGLRDAHGNVSSSYAASVEALAFAVYPVTSDEAQVGRDDVTIRLTVLVPLGTEIGPRDRVSVPGHEGDFDVDGDPADWSTGPFSWAPGLAFNLKRTEG